MIREWSEVFIRALIRTVLICGLLYGAYVIKSALGINLSQHYHAIDFFQSPIDVLTDIVHI
ncbi:MAG: hypothetical protein AAGD25_22575 [Cyanobacteria bacterium P01_F01_bin.150]